MANIWKIKARSVTGKYCEDLKCPRLHNRNGQLTCDQKCPKPGKKEARIGTKKARKAFKNNLKKITDFL